ncbi:MAG TPA: SRPBCC family protein [Candidatus Binatia bacterium]|jgi:uncharacterized membrane protein|nr:SRPBCC family protein [Candidatus Binatia bacterium]
MNQELKFLSGIAAGAGLMYLLDPGFGRRRRSILRDKAYSFTNELGDTVGVTARDLTNRARGVVAETQTLFRTEEVSDEVLVERVRAVLGYLISHPSSIDVTASHGRVTLSGPVLAEEEQRLLRGVAAVRGVTSVENRLEVHQQRDNVPDLQGGRRRERRFELMQTNWSPTARLIASLAGGTLAQRGLQRGGAAGLALGGIGLALLARGLSNLELRRLVGIRAGRRAVDLQKTITVAAPIEQVFALWTNYQNFPCFMSHVREVRDLGGGRSHWVVDGPAGIPIEWDAVVTKCVPHEVFAWKSEPGAVVQHAGIIHFEPTRDGGTRVHVQLSYNPPAGAVGHSLVWLFGADPKQQLDDDLLRMKTFAESGVPPHDAAATAQPSH